MNARELRIGNYVKCLDDVIAVEYVDKLLIKGVYHRDAIYNTSVQVKHCKPIPLTEELLLKFGFKKVVYASDKEGYGTEYNLKLSDDIYLNYLDDFSLGIYADETRRNNDFAVIPATKMVKYVHQLQNLIFALTGKEYEEMFLL